MAWEDNADWAKYDLVIPRSTWNYYERPNDFRSWIRRVDDATKLLNPSRLMLGNIHKSYLLDLEEEGVPIVPTRIVDSAVEIEEVFRETEWSRMVVKPAISAASYMTRVFSPEHSAEAQKFVEEILSSRDVILQEYMEAVHRGGEVSLIHVDGALTHCIVKSPRFAGDEESVSQASQPTPEQRQLARQVVSTIGDPWLYARVDIMLDNNGMWRLSELELIEPSLFFTQYPSALDRFVTAISRECA